MKPYPKHPFLLSLLFLSILLPGAVSAQDTYRFQRMWPALKQPWYFLHPFGVAVGPRNFVYVADSENNRIRKFNQNGQFITEWGKKGAAAGEFTNPTDIAVDRRGNVYIVDNDNHRVQKFTRDGAFLQSWGGEGSAEGQFERPFGIALDRLDFLYVTDSGNQRIQKFTTDGQFIAAWTGAREGDAESFLPRGIAAGPDGSLFVADNNNDRVQQFSPQGSWLGEWGTTGAGDGQFFDPDGIAVDGEGNVYVSDLFNHRIQQFSDQGDYLAQWGQQGSGPGKFENPVGLATDRQGHLFVADEGNNRIQKFAPDGRLIAVWGNNSDPGFFNLPGGIARDEDTGTIYVADTDNHRIQAFSSDGTFLRQWGGEGFAAEEVFGPEGLDVDDQGRVIVADTGNNRVQIFSPDGAFISEFGGVGNGDGEFIAPFDVAAGFGNDLFVLDTANHRVKKFTADGTFLFSWGAEGAAVGQFDTPRGIAVDDDGNVYVADTRNHRVQKFDRTGQPIATWGSEGPGEVQFDLPFGVDVGPNGQIYVADSENYRIQVLSASGEYIGAFGERGNAPGQFQYPSDVVAGSDGNLYTTDGDNHRVQVFREIAGGQVQKAILIAGGGPYPGNTLWDATRVVVNGAYQALRNQGFPKEQIRYLSPETGLDLDGNTLADDIFAVPGNEILRQSIVEWAADADRLVLYMADHGGFRQFRMSETETLSAVDLDGWLDDFQGTAIVVYDACNAGSFAAALAPETGQDRIVLASTLEEQDAYFINQGGISFSDFFWNAVFNGQSVGDAFSIARQALSDEIDLQTPSLTASPGSTPESLFLGGGNPVSDESPVITGVSPEQTISGAAAALLFAEVEDSDRIERVWAVVQPPANRPTGTDDPLLDLPTIELSPVSATRFEGTFEALPALGTYSVFVYARDEFGNTSAPGQTAISVETTSTRKAVIVAGGDESDPLWPAIRRGAESAYRACLEQGYTDDTLYFLSPAVISTGVDGTSTLDNLQFAIGDWASDSAGDLVVYLVGPARDGRFSLGGGAELAAGDLQIWLTDFQQTSGADVALVLDFDGSGLFHPALQPEGPARRIVISSTTGNGLAPFFSGGEVSFSILFWKGIREGEAVQTAVEAARSALELIGNSAAGSGPALDDSGNGIANEREDGNFARQFSIGFGIQSSPNVPTGGNRSSEILLTGETAASFSVDGISGIGRIERVQAIIAPPSADENATDDARAVTVSMEETGNGQYSARFDGFSAFGRYRISIQARDEAGRVSSFAGPVVYQSQGRDGFEVDDAQTSARPIRLNDANPQHHNFHSEADEDWILFPGMANEIYTIQVEGQEPDARVAVEVFSSDQRAGNRTTPIGEETLSYDWRCPGDGDVYIRLTNANAAGPPARTGYLVRVFRPIGPFAGFISGLVTSADTGRRLNRVRVTTTAKSSGFSRPDGGFFLVHEPGSFDLTFSASGYRSLTVSEVTVSEAAASIQTITLQPLDSDGDGVSDEADGCPNDPAKVSPGACGCGRSDQDRDGDSVPDCQDGCPDDPAKSSPGNCGCGLPEDDNDGDGVPNCQDDCPDDPDKAEPGICGCGAPDVDDNQNGIVDCREAEERDEDGDGVPDAADECPADPAKSLPGFCGCGIPDVDSDGDGTLDCEDGCPSDGRKVEPGACGCGISDLDSDGDGVSDCGDNCPDDPGKTEPGQCGCGETDTDMDGDGIFDCNDFDQAPLRPEPVSPLDGENIGTLRPVLETKPYVDPDGDVHKATRWQIGLPENAFSPPILDVSSPVERTAFQIPALALSPDREYVWRCAFVDESEAISEWSENQSFSTQGAMPIDDPNGNGVPENFEVDGFYDLDGDGQNDLEQDDIRLFLTPVANFVVGVKTEENDGHLQSVGLPESFPVDPQLNQLERTPMGVIQFQFSLAENVDTLPITLFWSRPAPEEANWFTYSYSDGWHGFDETGGMDFSGAGFVLELRDGGFGDMDGAKNGTILHTGALGIGLIEPQTFPTLRPSDDVESTGCFIDTFFFPNPNQ